jgi:hypothetical protein
MRAHGAEQAQDARAGGGGWAAWGCWASFGNLGPGAKPVFSFFYISIFLFLFSILYSHIQLNSNVVLNFKYI